MAKTIHTMIRVLDPKRSIAFYREAFGLEQAQRFDFDDFSLIYLRNAENDFEIELTWNHDQTEAYSHGSGYGHVAVVVDNLESEHERFGKQGWETGNLITMRHDGNPLARIFFVTDPDGYKIEVIERGGRYV